MSAATSTVDQVMNDASAEAATNSADEITSNGRARRKRSTVLPMLTMCQPVSSPSTSALPTKKKPRKQEQSQTEKEFSTSWICCECREAECMMRSDADELLICEGTCRRLFHFPCAGLDRLPGADEQYICKDCLAGSFPCAFCQSYGKGGSEVFRCSYKNCGLFYHPNCLVMRDVPFKVTEEKSTNNNDSTDDDASPEEPSMTYTFKCPAHDCWTCTQTDLLKKDREAGKSGKGKGKKAKRRPGSSAFDKRSGDLMRCLDCPLSFHVACIPPSAKFHELALLCHEHAYVRKMPELDRECSIQGTIEDTIVQKFEEMSEKKTTILQNKGLNAFFGGLRGNILSKNEEQVVEELRTNGEVGATVESRMARGSLPFSLPNNFKDTVHSKPPAYKHVNALKYDPANRPTRIPYSGDVCSCVKFCGEDCLNRSLYIECTGDKGVRTSNCAVGKNCGNRRLAKRQFAKCKPAREKGRGWGLITCHKIIKGELVTEYIGQVIDAATKEKCLKQWAEEHPNDPNFYVMSLSPQWFIDAREVANLARFINHSCDPNCRLTTVNVDGYLRNGIYATRDIEAGEFLSYDYKFDTRQGDKFICRCGGKNCRGTMKDGKKDEEIALSKKMQWEKAKKEYEKDAAFVAAWVEEQDKRRSHVNFMVPSSTNADELVSNGPHERHRAEVRRSRLFLWRNADIGSDFDQRLGKLEFPAARENKAPKRTKLLS